MRILHIGKFYPPFSGGMENFLGDLIPALCNTGVFAKALVHDTPQLSFVTAGFDRTARVHRVPCYGNILYAPVSPAFPYYLNRIINSFRPEILHLHLPNTSAFAVMALSSARHIPWVVHWHSDVVVSEIDRRMAAAYRLYHPFEQRLLSLSRAIVATSPPYLATSAALAPFRNKCRVIPLGLDRKRLKPCGPNLKKWAENTWGDKNTRVLAIGRLTYYKGHETLVGAAEKTPGIKVIIAGEGDRKRYLKGLISEKGVKDKVVLSGYLEEEKLQALLASCDCLCLPSVERTEAFGLVLLEAMAWGKAIVATRVPGSGMGWVVEHGKTGTLVPPNDATALAGALQNLSRQPEKRMEMGKAAKEKFNRFFRIGGVAEEVKLLYRDILL